MNPGKSASIVEFVSFFSESAWVHVVSNFWCLQECVHIAALTIGFIALSTTMVFDAQLATAAFVIYIAHRQACTHCVSWFGPQPVSRNPYVCIQTLHIFVRWLPHKRDFCKPVWARWYPTWIVGIRYLAITAFCERITSCLCSLARSPDLQMWTLFACWNCIPW